MKTTKRLEALHPMRAFARVQSEMARLRVNRLEERLAPLVPFPHKHDFFHLVVIVKGRGWHEIDFVRTQARAGQFYVMKPGQVHAWDLSERTCGFVIEFEASALDAEWLASFNPWNWPDAGLLPNALRTPVFDACARMLDEAENGKSPLLLKLELGAFLVRLSRVVGAFHSPSALSPEIIRFQAALEKFYRQEHGVEFYAREMGLPPKALAMRLSRALGRAPRELIQERCLLEARRLLAYSEASVSEISDQLGFETPNYFARLFRLKVGSAPGEFRRQVRARSGRAATSETS